MALFQFSICKNLNAQIYNDPDGNAHDSVLIFDRFGNTYDIRELQIPDNAALISMFNPCNAGIFRLDFMDIGNTGFNNTTDGAAYRAVACQVFTDLSELLIAANNPYTNLPNPPPFVDISLRAHTASTAVGIGSSFYNEQFNNVLWNNTTNRGLLDGEVWKTINGGINSFNSINLLVPSNVFHGFIELNFTSGFTLNTNFNIATPPGQLDVYEIILHEALHMLGITSFINSAGNSILAGSNFYTRFDSHLFLNNASTPLLNQVNSCGNQTYANANLTPGLCNIRFIDGGLNLPVFSPAIFGQGQSLSHLDGTCAPVTSYVINNGGGGFGSNRRHPTQQEVDVLCALGYHCSSEYGIAGSGFENHFDTYTACGSRIAGVDDWFHFNTTNPYVYLQGNPPLLLDDFLLNDEDESSPDNNPHAYECPTIIYGAGNITNPLATSFEFQPPANYSGLAVIRYIPLDANGRKGNFAYIFVQVNDLTPDEACGNTGCNIVIDGCLEQIPPLGPPAMHYFINTHNLQSNAFTINGSTTNSPDRYGWDGFTWSRYPPAGVTMQGLGCDGNNIITIAQSHNGQPANNFYAGLINAGANQEGLFFQLNAPLQTGVTYSGSFWASRKDSCPTVVEIYSTIGIPGNVNTATLNLISSNSVVATYNTWDNYAFSYTHNVVGPAHEYLIVRVVPTQGNNYPYVFFDDLYIEAELNVTANLNHPCTGQNNGSIDLTVITPGGPYTFLWSNSSTNEDITNLAAGTYTVSVTDNHNCTHTYTYILNDGGCDPVSIIKTVQPTTTYAGDPVTYAITICNNTTAPITGTFSDIFGNPANFSINCNGTANPFDPPIPFILQPGCTTLTFTGCFVEIGNDQCNLAVFTYNGNTISSEACVDVLVGCPMIVSGFGDCAPGSKLNICYGLHTVVSNVNGFDGIIIYPDFLTPTATLASTSIPTSLGVISNVTFTNVGALSTYTDPLNCPGCVYRSMQVQLDYTGPQTFTAWPYTLGCFEFEITGTVPLGHNHFILSCQDPTTLVLNNTQLNTQAGPLHYWTQSGHLLLNGCPGMPALPDAGFNIDKLSCTGQVTVTATNTSSTAIHKWEFGDNRTTPVLGANPYTYDYFAPITHSSNGAIIPPIDPAPPGTYTITHTVFDGGLYNQSTQTIDLYPTCCPADVMIKSGESSSMYGSSILANTIDIEGVFNIDNNFSFNNNQIVYMEPKAEIFVKAGATLEINSAILNKCTYMWRGITVESGGNIQVYNNGVIADAEKAMTMEDETSFTLDNANLVNNVTGVFVPQNPVDAMWNINGYCAASYFALTGPLASPYPGQTPFGKIPYAGMDISNVYMTIGDNSKMYNTFGELNLGILTRSSFLEVRNSFFATIFKDLAYGNNKHDGSCIAAFGGHGTSFRLDVYPISPLAQFPPPTMTQADRGVYSKFINTKIAGVKMNSMKTGVETELCTNGMETKVFDCEINARDYGINWYNNAGSSNMLAANNNIRVHGNKFGACVRIAELNQFANYKITDNDLYAVEILNGIVSTAVVKPQITYNRVYQNTLGVNKPSSDGITINGGFGAMLTCNNVYTNYPYLGNTRGYVINGSQSYLIECNHCYGHVTGFYFGGDCSNSQDAFRGNSMSNCLEGLYLNNTALISTQTLRGNQWLGNAGPYGAENQNTGFLNASKFEVNNTPIQFPNTPTFMPNNIGWFSINPLSVYDCATNSTCIAQAQDGDDDAAFRYQVAHDSTITAAYIPEAKNIAQQNLYDALMSVSTTIYSDSVMYNFYINNANGNIGKLYEAKQKFYASNEPNPYKLMLLKTCDSLILVKKDSIELIDSLNNNAALIGYETLRENLINSISSIVQSQAIISAQIKQDADNAISIMETENSAVQATEVPETNEKYINEIHVLYNDQGLDGIKTHYNDILAIAQQCPYSGGNAVYIARNYIALLGDTIVYDDAAICLLQGIFRNASTNTNAIEIYLKPNPANDYVELFIANNTGTNCSVSISDAIGKEHLSIKVDCKLKAVKINTQKLAIGLYTVSFSAEGLVLKTQKLIIER